ncbi:hypothetical protein [Nitrospina gracilis]|uniref:hypothetical protein n=1 Tax=Nitrospina gracilis TaxID=35801 RepID=UPI001F3C8210|nr:hypothetical protein [Nitrospina gracilis]MCF8719372.1 ABC-type polysaccharide/polyol phosphate export permease [Nitrospina gracilis Nb-211]
MTGTWNLLNHYLKTVHAYRNMIKALTRREIKVRNVGSLGKPVWSIIHSLVIMLVYWMVSSVDFKVQPVSNVPFIVAFLCGFIQWTLLDLLPRIWTVYNAKILIIDLNGDGEITS